MVTLSERDHRMIVEMQVRLAAKAQEQPNVAAALARRRHETSVNLGLKCPKPLNCLICRPNGK